MAHIIVLSDEHAGMLRDQAAEQFDFNIGNTVDIGGNDLGLSDEERNAFIEFAKMYARIYLSIVYQGYAPLPSVAHNPIVKFAKEHGL